MGFFKNSSRIIVCKMYVTQQFHKLEKKMSKPLTHPIAKRIAVYYMILVYYIYISGKT